MSKRFDLALKGLKDTYPSPDPKRREDFLNSLPVQEKRRTALIPFLPGTGKPIWYAIPAVAAAAVMLTVGIRTYQQNPPHQIPVVETTTTTYTETLSHETVTETVTEVMTETARATTKPAPATDEQPSGITPTEAQPVQTSVSGTASAAASATTVKTTTQAGLGASTTVQVILPTRPAATQQNTTQKQTSQTAKRTTSRTTAATTAVTTAKTTKKAEEPTNPNVDPSPTETATHATVTAPWTTRTTAATHTTRTTTTEPTTQTTRTTAATQQTTQTTRTTATQRTTQTTRTTAATQTTRTTAAASRTTAATTARTTRTTATTRTTRATTRTTPYYTTTFYEFTTTSPPYTYPKTAATETYTVPATTTVVWYTTDYWYTTEATGEMKYTETYATETEPKYTESGPSYTDPSYPLPTQPPMTTNAGSSPTDPKASETALTRYTTATVPVNYYKTDNAPVWTDFDSDYDSPGDYDPWWSEFADYATDIVTGRITNVRYTMIYGMPYTAIDVEVTSALRGKYSYGTLTVMEPGGYITLDALCEISYEVEKRSSAMTQQERDQARTVYEKATALPEPRIGEECLLFLTYHADTGAYHYCYSPNMCRLRLTDGGRTFETYDGSCSDSISNLRSYLG